MMDGGGVSVDHASVLRAWRATEDGEFWIQVVTKDDADDAIGIATNTANDAFPDGVFGQLTSPTPKGFALLIDGVLGPDDLQAWTEVFATSLTDHGITGGISGARNADPPPWMYRGYPIDPVLFVAYTQDPAMVAASTYGGDWCVAPEPTARICATLAEWVTHGGPQILVKRGLFEVRVKGHGTIAATLAAGLPRQAETGALCTDRRTQTGREVRLIPKGGATLQSFGTGIHPAHHIKALRDAMRTHAADIDLSFTRWTSRGAGHWSDLSSQLQPLPGFRESDIRYRQHLLADYVPDAHGLQVLTDSHLAKAHDLSAWHIEDLGGGRHLVSAPDLAAWYQAPPEPDLVTQARRDFGNMILTKEIIAAHPVT